MKTMHKTWEKMARYNYVGFDERTEDNQKLLMDKYRQMVINAHALVTSISNYRPRPSTRQAFREALEEATTKNSPLVTLSLMLIDRHPDFHMEVWHSIEPDQD